MATEDNSAVLCADKVCRLCGVTKPVTEFHRTSNGRPAARCKGCAGRTQKSCQVCGAVFLGRSSGNYCTPKCRGIARSDKHRNCPQCGSLFRVIGYQLRKYCSFECSIAARGSKPSPLKGRPRPDMRRYHAAICARCGKEFEAKGEYRGHQRIYCSRECQRPKLCEIGCERCGKVFKPPNSKQKFCGRKCSDQVARVRQAGSNSHFWRGGMTQKAKLLRTGAAYREWRTAVFRRDGYRCVKCGAKSRVGQCVELHPHHIEPLSDRPDLAFVVPNGVTLCKSCHEKTDSYGYKQSRKRCRVTKSNMSLSGEMSPTSSHTPETPACTPTPRFPSLPAPSESSDLQIPS